MATTMTDLFQFALLQAIFGRPARRSGLGGKLAFMAHNIVLTMRAMGSGRS